LVLKIPWSNLKGEPVRVLIKNIFVLAGPKKMSEYDPEEDDRRRQKRKQDKLETLEMLSTKPKAPDEDDAKQTSFTMQLITKIVDNLQVSIHNIHVRYEDNISNPDHMFAAGITLSELSAVSTDENWNVKFLDQAFENVHKLLKMGHLAVYFNSDTESLSGQTLQNFLQSFTDMISGEGVKPPGHSYILKPVSGTGRLILKKKFTPSTAKNTAMLLFDQLAFILNDRQYKDLLLLVSSFDYFIRQHRYRKFRPPNGITVKKNPKIWLQFALQCVLSEVQERRRKWTWAYFEERRDDRLRYLDLYRAVKLDTSKLAEKKELDALERKLSFQDIRFYRSLVEAKLRKEKAIQVQQQPAGAPAEGEAKSWVGSWFGSWSGGQNNASQPTLSEEQLQELYHTIDFDENQAVPDYDLPDECMLLQVNMQLNKGSFTYQRQHGVSPRSLLSINFDTFRFGFIKRLRSFTANLSLHSFNILDGTTEHSLYPYIISVQGDMPRRLANDTQEGDPPAEPFFQLTFENNPLDHRADSALTLQSRRLHFFFNPNAIETMVKFFRPPIPALDSMHNIIAAAGRSVEGFKQQTRAGLQFALEEHTTIDIQIDLDAPVIIIPTSFTDPRALVTVLDSGRLKVRSNLVGHDRLNEWRAKEGKELTDSELDELKSLMYDRFAIDLTSLQLVVGKSVHSCLEAIQDSAAVTDGDLHVLNRINLQFEVGISIIPQYMSLPKMVVEGHLPLVKLNFSDRKYRAIMKFVDMLDFLDRLDGDPSLTLGIHGTASLTSQGYNLHDFQMADSESDTGDDLLAAVDDHLSSSDAGSENNDGDKFYDAETYEPADDGEAERVHSKQIVLNFTIGEMSASLRRSDRDIEVPETYLAELKISDFSLNFVKQPYNMTALVHLGDLEVEDRMHYGSYLLTSAIHPSTPRAHLEEDSDSGGSTSPAERPPLMRVEYQRVDPLSPEFASKYEGMRQSVDVRLSSVNVNVIRGSILTLHDFILKTFVPNDNQSPANPPLSSANDVSANTSPQAIGAGFPDSQNPPAEPIPDPATVRVRVNLNSINLMLNNDEVQLATLSLSHADIAVLVRDRTMRVGAKLGNLTLTDDCAPSNPLTRPEFRHLLSMEGGDLANFSYETFDATTPAKYPGFDAALFLRVGSARLVVAEEPVRALMEFGSKFAQMHVLFDAARQAASEQAAQLQERANRFHFNINIKTPVLVFPESTQRPDTIVANLGEINFENRFVDMDEADDDDARSRETDDSEAAIAAPMMNKMFLQISSIRLASALHLGAQSRVQELPLIADLNLGVAINIVDHTVGSVRPEVEITAKLSDVHMKLTERQYQSLLNLGNILSHSFAFPDHHAFTSEAPSHPTTTASGPPPANSTAGTIQEGPTYTTLDLVFNLETIDLEIFHGDGTQCRRGLSEASFSRFCSENLVLKHMIKSNQVSESEVQVFSFAIQDTRPNSRSKFRDILPVADHSGPQLLARVDSRPGEDTILMATVDHPRVILDLNHMFAMKDYFLSAFNQPPSGSGSDSQSDQSSAGTGVRRGGSASDPPAENTPATQFAFRINIVQPEVLLLADATNPGSEAVVLSMEQVVVAQQGIFALTMEKIEMSLCRMDRRADTSVSFIDPFDVVLSMHNGSTRADHMLTNIIVDIKPLVLRVSYEDISLLLEIANTATQFHAASSSSSSTNLGRPVVDTGALADPLPVKSTPTRLPAAVKKVTVSREIMKLAFQGAQVVLIGNKIDIPVVDVTFDAFSVNLTDWSTQIKIDVNLRMHANYYNLQSSHWEPLVEPWQFGVHLQTVSDPHNTTRIDIQAKHKLDINISHAFIETMLNSVSELTRDKDNYLYRTRVEHVPYQIKNQTGTDLYVWNELPNSHKNQTSVRLIKNQETLPWRFGNWHRSRDVVVAARNKIGLQFTQVQLESLKDIPVDRESSKLYRLRPKLDDISHRLAVDVRLLNNVKQVVLRSSLVFENRTLLPLEMVMVDHRGQFMSTPQVVPPGEDFPVPVLQCHIYAVKVRPVDQFHYSWSSTHIYWVDFLTKTPPTNVICPAEQRQTPDFVLQVHGRYKRKDVSSYQYPFMNVRLSAPIEIENLLPYDIIYTVVDKVINREWKSKLSRGAIAPVHVVRPGHLLLMALEVPGTPYKRSRFAVIDASSDQDMDVDDQISLIDNQRRELPLRLDRRPIPDTGGAHIVSIYAPYVMINQTGLAMLLKSKSLIKSASVVAGQSGEGIPGGDNPKPFMFSYDSYEPRNRCLIKFSGGDWSKPLSFDAVGSLTEVVIPSLGSTTASTIHVGISVEPGPGKFSRTKVVSFTPRYLLKNNLKQDLNFREVGTPRSTRLAAGQRAPLHFIHQIREKQLTINFPGLNNYWSAPFLIDEVGKLFVKLNTTRLERILVRVDVVLEGACIFILFSQVEGEWPYRIENASGVDVTLYQYDPSLREAAGAGADLSGTLVKKYRLPAGKTMSYSWDYPSMRDKQLVLNVKGHERHVDIQQIGTLIPFKFASSAAYPNTMSVDVIADHATQVLRLTSYNQNKSIFKPKLQRKDTLREAFEIVDVSNVTTMTFRLRLEGIGLSLINAKLQELMYTTFRGIEFKYTDSTCNQSLNWMIEWVQIDNQLYGGLNEILLYPTIIPKTGQDTEIRPTLHVALVRAKDESYGVNYIRYFSILLQEMSLEMDEDFLFALLEFAKFGAEKSDEQLKTEEDRLYCETVHRLPEPPVPQDEMQLYFEVLHIQPLKFNLSFVRTQRINQEMDPTNSQNPLMVIGNAITMAIGNVNDAPVKLNALVIENVRASMTILLDRFTKHYGQEALYQIHKVLGSADVIGNPVGLFNNISSGVADFFYEPYHGFVMSDRPQDFGIGLARGTYSLFSKTVYGFSDSFSKFAESVSKGLSVATLDKSYQDRRRISRTRNRPRHALYGVSQGATSFASSVASGITGVVMQPIQGAEKEGLGGFFKGVGKGLVGVVTKPMVGVFDLASHVTEGIKNTTTVFNAVDLDRVRLPRFVARDGILHPYNQRDALGQFWLKQIDNGDYFYETYLAHLELRGSEMVALVTYSKLMLIKSRSLSVEWVISLSALQSINLEATGISLTLRGNEPGPFIPIPEASSRRWLYRKLEEAVRELTQRKNDD
ncbi:hypothetical protein BJ085DRAFT_22499, partial [Dimargaris cristalligena]